MADLLSDVAGAVAGGAAGSNPVSVLGTLADDIFNAIFPSEQSKATAEATQLKAQVDAYVAKATVNMQPMIDQLKINATEAANPSWFVAGARPAAMWVGVVGMAVYFWPTFLLGEFFWAKACWAAGRLVERPDLGFNDLLGIVAPLLGLGAMRTIDKIKGTDTKAVGGQSLTVPAVKQGRSK